MPWEWRDETFFFVRLVGMAKEFSNLQLPLAQLVKNLLAMQETWVQSLGWEDPPEKGKATHSSIVAWRISWTIQSMGSQRVRHHWVTFTFTSYTHYPYTASLSTYFSTTFCVLRRILATQTLLAIWFARSTMYMHIFCLYACIYARVYTHWIPSEERGR